MQNVSAKLTVFFEEPFWVGIYERESGGKLSACKIVFGVQPSDYEVYAYFLEKWRHLCFSAPVKQGECHEIEKKRNPKRMQREIQNQLARTGAGTKAQQALALEREQVKTERQERQRRRRQEEKDLRFQYAQQKKKERHKGH